MLRAMWWGGMLHKPDSLTINSHTSMNLIGQPIAVIGLGYVGLHLAVEFGKRYPVLQPQFTLCRQAPKPDKPEDTQQ